MATAQKAASKVVPSDEGAAAAPKKSKKLLLIGALAVVLAGGGAAWYFMDAKANKDAKAEAAPALPPVYLAMEQFTVNLQSENGDQYLQTAFTLQVANQAQVDQIKLYMPLVRSRLLMLLSGKKAAEVGTPEGKAKLQEEIVATLREPYAPNTPEVGVTGVFFTAFVVQ